MYRYKTISRRFKLRQLLQIDGEQSGGDQTCKRLAASRLWRSIGKPHSLELLCQLPAFSKASSKKMCLGGNYKQRDCADSSGHEQLQGRGFPRPTPQVNSIRARSELNSAQQRCSRAAVWASPDVCLKGGRVCCCASHLPW